MIEIGKDREQQQLSEIGRGKSRGSMKMGERMDRGSGWECDLERGLRRGQCVEHVFFLHRINCIPQNTWCACKIIVYTVIFNDIFICSSFYYMCNQTPRKWVIAHFGNQLCQHFEKHNTFLFMEKNDCCRKCPEDGLSIVSFALFIMRKQTQIYLAQNKACLPNLW